MTQSLIGRHSVALMPLISHAKGSNDNNAIIGLIKKQFRFYSYAALFISFMFWLNYHNLISVWTGHGQYAGDTIMHLLVLNFFFGTIGYFMSNMGYALGDIKMNSLVNIIRGLLLGLSLFIVAPRYGIVGTLMVTLSVILVTDFFYFSFRLYKIGYLPTTLLKNILSNWLFIIPFALTAGWGCREMVDHLFITSWYIPRLVLGSISFAILFIILVLLVDSEMRASLAQLKRKIYISPVFRMMRA
jgi:O-antigen/teichoic acid export membrane protein